MTGWFFTAMGMAGQRRSCIHDASPFSMRLEGVMSATEQPLSLSAAGRLMKTATYASVAVAVTLVVVKTFAWVATDSVSILSTLVDSMLDAAASVVNLLAVRHALQPADEEHRFGHGKAEPLAGLAQAAFIGGSATFLLLEAGERFFKPQDITQTQTGFTVMGISIVLTLVLVLFQRYVVAKTNSLAIKADTLHYKTDLLVNVGVIAALFLSSRFGWYWADPFVALAIAVYIGSAARTIIRDSFDVLMDHELPEKDRQTICDIALAQAGVIDVHDLRTRSSGLQCHIQIHVEMNADITLRKSHEIAESVATAISSAFPNADIMVHQDPEGVDERRLSFD
jgi:ferrous-iron efflux pump FieF